jgi:gamma-butyrobetaine dioxygenase
MPYPIAGGTPNEVDMQAASPMISVDQDGNVVGVRFNDRVAAPLVLPEEAVEPFYVAFIQLARLYERKDFWFRSVFMPAI